jgi:hypothetical protein
MMEKMKHPWKPYDGSWREAAQPAPDLLERDNRGESIPALVSKAAYEPAPAPREGKGPKQVPAKEKEVVYEPVSALEKEFTANFKSRKNVMIPPIQVPATLDIASERNTTSKNWAFGRKMWTAGEESEIEKPRPFRGRRGLQLESRSKIALEWRPVGSEKWVITEFYIVLDGESEVVLGKEFVDFQGIFHDLDLDMSPFRLPGMKRSRGKNCQRGLIHLADCIRSTKRATT